MKRAFKGFAILTLLVLTSSLTGFFVTPLEEGQGSYFYLVNEEIIAQVLNQMSLYRSQGLITQLDSDMGDTLQRTGSYYTLLNILGASRDDLNRPLSQGYNEDLKALTHQRGIYRRSNDPSYWGFDPENCSRDQIFAAQAAIVAFKDFKRGRELFAEFMRRGFLNQNSRPNWAYPWQEDYSWKIPDIPTPSQLSLLLRGLGNKAVYPLVFILDAFIIVDIQLFRKLDSRELWDYDIKQFPALLSANTYLPTIWSKWGLQLYLRDKQDVIARIQNYNLKKYNGIKPLADLYMITLEKLDDSSFQSEISNDGKRGPASKTKITLHEWDAEDK